MKFGLRKQVGAIAIDDEARAIQRLRNKFPEREAAVVNVKEALDRKALRRMTAGDLAKLGVSIGEPTDAVVIDVAESDVDKLIEALVEDPEAIETEAAA